MLSAKELRELFLSRGLKVSIYGCGCCGSPGIEVRNAETDELFYESDGVNIDEFSE